MFPGFEKFFKMARYILRSPANEGGGGEKEGDNENMCVFSHEGMG